MLATATVLLVGTGIDAATPAAGQARSADVATGSAVQLVQTGMHAVAGTAKLSGFFIEAADVRIGFVYRVDAGAGSVANVALATICAIVGRPVGAGALR